jgi:hypothetical protein
MRPGRSSSPRVTFRQQTTRCLVSEQTRHSPLFPCRDVFTGHCRNLLPRWSSQQFQKIQRSSCRKRHGQLILVLDLGLRPNDHSRHRHGVGVPRAGRQPAAASISVGRTPPRVPNAPTATRRTSSVFALRGHSFLGPGVVALFPRGHHHLHPTRLRSALRPTATKVIPTTWGETANHSGGADYRREGRPILAGFPCAVNPGGLSGSPGAVG